MRIMKEVLELEDDDILIKSLKDSGIETIPQLLSMKDKDIDDLHTVVESGIDRKIPLAKRNYVRIIKSWNIYLQNELNTKSID